MIKLTAELQARMRAQGVETFHAPGIANFPDDASFEPPCSIKWISMAGQFRMGAFSYAVNGHFHRITIGRYCSIGEQIQAGRSDHPMTGASTSAFFYAQGKLFDIGQEFDAGAAYHAYNAPPARFDIRSSPVISIGNDVWIGHGAYIRPGVTIGDGAVIGAMSVVLKDVPPFAIVAGNPAAVRRMRLPPPIAAELQELAWWRFAPWQLTDVNFSTPRLAVDHLRRLIPTLRPYAPQPVILDRTSPA